MNKGVNNDQEQIKEVLINEQTTKEEYEIRDKPDDLKSILYFFVKQFGKGFAIRTVYSLILLFSSYKKMKHIISFPLIIKTIFSLPNLRTSLFFSITPSLNRLLHFLYKTDSQIFTFFAGFTSGLIGVLIEEKTSLTNFVIFSILARVIHIFLIIGLDHFRINFSGKKASFTCFLLVAIPFMLLSIYHPSYEPIRKLFDSYANYIDDAERNEVEYKRNNMRLV
jgi:hypothetical protein